MADAPKQKRQLVNFRFYKLDPAFRRLSQAEQDKGKQEFAAVIEKYRSQGLMVFVYSTMGIRSECDFLVWSIGYALESFEGMASETMKTGLGKYLETAHSYISMTKHSVYVDKHSHPGQEGRRLVITPGESKYLFIYPFVKTRPWYVESKEERQKMMDTHIAVGHKYPSVKLNTTYSFGIDDQEFVVAFETDSPDDFLDLVQELREAKSSLYTLRDTPTFTCIRKDLPDLLSVLS